MIHSRGHHRRVFVFNQRSAPATLGFEVIQRLVCRRRSILLADEPTGNLDSATCTEIMALFARLHEAGNTIILVTHEADIAAHAHRVIRVSDGEIEGDEPTPLASQLTVAVLVATSSAFSWAFARVSIHATSPRERRVLISAFPSRAFAIRMC